LAHLLIPGVKYSLFGSPVSSQSGLVCQFLLHTTSGFVTERKKEKKPTTKPENACISSNSFSLLPY
jgi:hypothetical protein